MASKKKVKKAKPAKVRKATKAKKIAKARKTKKASKRAKAQKVGKAKKVVKAKKKSARRANPLKGKGSQTAVRNYDREQEKFVADNRNKISKMAPDAETAHERPEGNEPREAERGG